jgi:hypothetical protein
MNLTTRRVLGNWLVSTLSPLIGGTLTFQMPVEPEWLKVILTAFVSGSIVTALVIGNHWQNGKK